jgi:isopropylmalate/homocitrate/citramalate synthase
LREYSLKDVKNPNLLKDTFLYSLPPRIFFEEKIKEIIDDREVEFDAPSVGWRDLFITDTTFRDGQQSRPPYSIEQTKKIFEMLSRAGGPNGIIRQSEFFLYTKQDRLKVDACRELGLTYPQVTGWIRTQKGEIKSVLEMGIHETGMLTSCSDYHIFHKQKQTRSEAYNQYIRTVESALEAGIRPRCHLEDITRADIRGFVIPFVQRLENLSEQVPDTLKVKIRLCDTMGFGLFLPGIPEPRSIPKLIWRLANECGISSDRMEWHGHNDFHKVHGNALSAWVYGCDAVNTTLFGIGERTGNPPLEGALVEYVSLKGSLNGIQLPVITELADYYRSAVDDVIPANYPFVGRDFNTTRAGIHAGGLRKNEEIYNIFDTASLLNRPPKVVITDKSGTDGIALWVNNFLGLTGKERLTLTKVAKIQRWVMDQYEKKGRRTAISERELAEQVKLHFPELYRRATQSLPVFPITSIPRK